MNSETKKETVLQWRNQLAELGLQAMIWNVSYYNGINYSYQREGSQSFISELMNKTVIFLNNLSTANENDEKIRATDFLAQSEILEAAISHNISAYIIGGGPDMSSMVIPFTDRAPKLYDTCEDLISAQKEIETHQFGYGKFDIFSSRHFFPTKPSEDSFIKHVSSVSAQEYHLSLF